MNFQVTVLKILVSYPEGFASLEDLKRDMAILATSGKEWSERTKRLRRESRSWRFSPKGWWSGWKLDGASPSKVVLF